jgi:hypothetical protein
MKAIDPFHARSLIERVEGLDLRFGARFPSPRRSAVLHGISYV